MTTKNSSTKKTASNAGLRAAIAGLAGKPLADLRGQYEQATGKAPGDLSKNDLIKHLAVRATQGGAAAEATTEVPAAKAPRAPRPPRQRDPRLPAPGGSIKRTFKGREYTLEILDQGFRVGSKEYRSSSAAALGVTGYQGTLSGPAWWGYAKPAAPTNAPEAHAKVKAPKSKGARSGKAK